MAQGMMGKALPYQELIAEAYLPGWPCFFFS